MFFRLLCHKPSTVCFKVSKIPTQNIYDTRYSSERISDRSEIRSDE